MRIGPRMRRPPTRRSRLRRRSTAGASSRLWWPTAGPVVPQPVRRRTRPRRRRVLAAAGRAGRGPDPGFAVHHLGLSWSGPERAGRVRLRYADGWRAWQPLLATDSGRRRPAPAPVLRRRTPTAYEVEPAAGVTGLRVSRDQHRATGRDTGTPRDRVRRWTGLTYLSRAGWGADESLRFEPDGTEKFPTAFFDVQTLTVHHTGDRQQRPATRPPPSRADLLLPVHHRGLRRHRLPPADRPGRHGLRGPLLRAGPAPGLRAAIGSDRVRRW